MDAKLKAKWLRALRGGQYRQAKGRLANKTGTAFCCLGVLADIQGCLWKDRANSAGELLPVNPKGGNIIGDGVIESPVFDGGLTNETQRLLASMNDQKGTSFRRLADYIEQNL